MKDRFVSADDTLKLLNMFLELDGDIKRDSWKLQDERFTGSHA